MSIEANRSFPLALSFSFALRCWDGLGLMHELHPQAHMKAVIVKFNKTLEN